MSKNQKKSVPRNQILAYRNNEEDPQPDYQLYSTPSAYKYPITAEHFNTMLDAFRNSARQMNQTLQNWTSPEDIAVMRKSYADQAKWMANASQQLRAQNPYDLQLNQQLDATIDWVSGIGSNLQKLQQYYGQWTNKGAYDRDMRSYNIATMDVGKAKTEATQLQQQIQQLKQGGALKNLGQISQVAKQLAQKNWDIAQATKYQSAIRQKKQYDSFDLEAAANEVTALRQQRTELEKLLKTTQAIVQQKKPASSYAASSGVRIEEEKTAATLAANLQDLDKKIAAKEQEISAVKSYRESQTLLKEQEANIMRLQELDIKEAAKNITEMRRELRELEAKRQSLDERPANSYAAAHSGGSGQPTGSSYAAAHSGGSGQPTGSSYAAAHSLTAKEQGQYTLNQQIQQLQQKISAAEQDVRDAAVLQKVANMRRDSRYESWIQAGMKVEGDAVVEGYDPNKTPEDKGSVYSPLMDAFGTTPVMQKKFRDEKKKDLYSCMTAEEFETYCGLLGKGDTDGAKEYLRYLEETLNARRATFAYENMAGVEKMLYWLPAGLESGATGVLQWFSGEPQPVSTTQMVSGMVQQEASEISPILGYAYGAGQSIANMAPSILVSTATGNPFAGVAFMGMNAGGNSYAEALRQGKTQTQAMGYGVVSGLSEVGLSYLLTGIGKLSGAGNLTRRAMGKLDAIASVGKRAAGKFGVAYAGELVEEEMQLFLDPFYRKIFFNEDYDAPTASEIFETAFVTLLTTAAYEGKGTIKGELDAETYRKLYENKLDYLTADILNIDPGSELAQQMQKRLDEGQKITAEQIRSLVQEYGNALAKASPGALNAHTAYIEQQEAEAAKQDFAPDLSKYKGRQQESVKRAMESGLLNNTRMTHTLVDLISKLEADKGVTFNWADNERLKESGFALEGKIVNGVKTADGIILNVDSAKALNTVAGHEITHVLEGTEFYDDFRRLMVQFAKARGEYDSRMADLKQLYKDGTDLEAELVADIVGDYIFTDEAFVRLLQTGKRGLFQTVYDEIKYLRRMATAGSKEARTLIKAEKLFEKLYRQPVEVTAETKYSQINNAGHGEISAKYWYPKMTKTERAEVKDIAQHEAKTTDNYLGIDVKWMYNKQKGHEYFALYSTQREKITLLYACKDDSAEYEYGLLKDIIELEDGLYENIDTGSTTIGEILNRVANAYNRPAANHNGTVESASNAGNAAVHSRNRGKRPSKAFLNCIENISKVQSRYGVDDHYLFAVERGDLKNAQRMVDEAAERWGAYRNNDEANEVFHQDGKVRTFYHGTNTGDFTTFDSRLLGSSSGDLGWFGKGFYFAFSHDEAATYGSRVIPAYLKMRNPYDYSSLYKFKGSDKGATEYARFAWVYNITKQFPDIAEGQRVWAYPNDAEEGSAVSWKQLTAWMDRIQKEKQFSVEEVELSDGTTAWELRADPKKESFTTEGGETFEWTEYGMKQIFATEQDAKEPINQIGAYLKNVMGVDSIPRRTIEKIDFSGALQRAGYDGILQSMSGDEAVVFSPEQIKTSEPVTYDDDGNVIPLSQRFNPDNKDIRHSLSKAGAQYAPRRGFSIPGEAVKLRREAETADAAHDDLDTVSPEGTPVAEDTAQSAPDQPTQPQQPEAQLPQEQQTAARPDRNVQPKEAPQEQPSQDLQPQEPLDEQPTEQSDEHPAENDKGSVIKRRALELYEESKNMQKGVKVSNDLSYLLDHIEKTPDGYRQLRTALLNIKNSPMETVDHRSKIEAVARERMQWYYEKHTESAQLPEENERNWKPPAHSDDQLELDPQPDEHPTEEKKEPIEVGASVFAFDRGNVGVVQGYNAETGEYTVTFRNEQGQRSTRTLPADMVTEISTETTAHAKSIEEQLTLRLRNSQQELEGIERHRQEAWETKAAQIKAKEEKLAAMKNQDTRAANSLKRSIESLKRRQADEDARYDKKLQDIQRRITDLKEELRRDYTQKNKLNAALERIDSRLARDEVALKEHYDGLIAEASKAEENKGAIIKKRALELYEESKNMKKGVKVSNDLSYLLDHIEKTPEDYQQLREALLHIKNSPLETVDHESTVESVARERMQWYYEDQAYSVQELESRYSQELEELREKAEDDRQKAQNRYEVSPYQAVKKRLQEEASNAMGNTAHWKDKKWGLFYKTETLQRNLGDVIRNEKGERDPEREAIVYDFLQGNYNRNEAELKRESQRLKKVFEDMKINQWESVYIQMIGEYRYNPDTKLSPDTVKEFYQDHKKDINLEKVNKAIVEARKLYDDLFLRVNMVLRKQGFKTMSYRQGYFPHFEKEKESRLAKLLNWKTVDTEIPTSIAGMTENFTPERSWQGFNKTRKGDTTDYNFLKGLDTYIHGALDWIYHIEDLQIRRAFENEIRYRHSPEGIRQKVDEIRNNPALDADSAQQLIDNVFTEAKNPLNNFVTDLRNSTNNLAGKKDAADRKMEEDTRRRAYATMTNISSRVSANMVVGSFSSALTNLIPITQSWAQVSPMSSVVATINMIRNAFRSDGLIERSAFMTNRLIPEKNLNNSGWDKIGNVAGAAMNFFDHISTEIVWRSKFQENMKKGMTEDEAIRDADQFAENVMAGRSRGNMPTIFNAKNMVTKMFTAFQLEVANQYGYMFKDLPREVGREHKAKLAWGYGKMFVGAYLFNSLLQTITGRAAAFDPIRLLTAFLGDLGFGPDDEDEDDGVKKATMNLAENVMKEMPFIGGLMGGGRIPISSALPYGDQGGVLEAIEAIYDDVSGMITDGDGKYANRFLKQMSNPLLYLLMPMGGGQIKKTIEGASMYLADHPVDGSYTNSGDLRYPVDDDPWSVVQALLFGQYANNNAREYFDKGYKPMGAKAIKEYKDLGVPIETYRAYKTGLSMAGETTDDQGREMYRDEDGTTYWYDQQTGKVYRNSGILVPVSVHELRKVSGTENQVEFISRLPLSDFQKDVLYRSVVDSQQTNEYGYTRYFGTETVNGRQHRTTYYYDGRNGILYDEGYNRVDYSLMKDLELAPKPSMSDYDRYSGYDEFKFAQNDPYRYEFLQTNGVSWQEYTEQKEVYDWAWNNPTQEAMSKVIAGDIPAYKSIHDDLASLHSTRDADGKVTVERKEKVQAYIADIDLPEIQKKILYKLEYPSYDEASGEIAEYIVALPGASTQEKKDILIALGFKVDANGKITWD